LPRARFAYRLAKPPDTQKVCAPAKAVPHPLHDAGIGANPRACTASEGPVKPFKRLCVCSLLAAASMQAMACYTVYDRSNRVVYQGEDAPVDMSLPIHETLPARFPGGHMVFDSTTDCPAIVASARARIPGGATPLLTNKRTAQSMGVPYTTVAGDIALVQPRDAYMAPGVTVIPGTTFPEATRMMGAGPAPRR